MKRWVTKDVNINYESIAKRYRVSEVFAEVLAKRGANSWKELDVYLFDDRAPAMDITPTERMAGMPEAADILLRKIDEGKKIRVIGDYDVDGVMASYILYEGMTRLGGQLSYQIPHRQRDGYGMRTYMAEQAAEDGVDTIVTCDNGISAMDAIGRAKELGLTIVLTDHHEVAAVDGVEQIPPADAVVDPKQAACAYGYRDLCGASIAFKLIEYMFRLQGKEEEAKEFLPFAAIATVCDVVPLQGENRNITKQGLRLITQTKNPGLQALMQQMDLKREITATDFGFRLGPCINAAGRLEDAAQALELFLEKDIVEAERKAEHLHELNEGRKLIQDRAFRTAVQQVEGEALPKVVVIYSAECSESVAGIVAGKLREKYYRPVYVLTDSGEELKGSGRSIPGYHMQQSLLECRELLTQFGGHAKAAGFSLKKENLEALREKLLENCFLSEEDFVEEIYYDAEVSLANITEELVKCLSYLEPIGEGNGEAAFVKRDAEIDSLRMCGKENQVAQIRLRENGKIYEAVDFHAEECLGAAIKERYGETVWEEMKAGQSGTYRVDLLFKARINERYGTVQYQILDCQA